MTATRTVLLAAAGRTDGVVKAKTFEDGGAGFVLYVERSAGAALSRWLSWAGC
jgi:hypothetical protein